MPTQVAGPGPPCRRLPIRARLRVEYQVVETTFITDSGTCVLRDLIRR